MKKELDPRNRLVRETAALLEEAADPTAITVRDIAKRARVGIGLLNYHFGTKEALFFEAIGLLMGRDAGLGSMEKWPQSSGPARERVRALLKQTSHVALRYPALTPMLARTALLGGDYGPERNLLPLLRDHFGSRLAEPELRLTAIQLVAPLQVMAADPERLRRFAELDVTEETTLDRVIDRLVDNVLTIPEGGKE